MSKDRPLKNQCIRYYALWIDLEPSLTAARLTKVFDKLALLRRYPAKIRLDNGTKIDSHHTIVWAEKQTVKIEYFPPGKPAEKGLLIVAAAPNRVKFLMRIYLAH